MIPIDIAVESIVNRLRAVPASAAHIARLAGVSVATVCSLRASERSNFLNHNAYLLFRVQRALDELAEETLPTCGKSHRANGKPAFSAPKGAS